MKMKMRFCRVSGVADQTQRLASLDLIARLDPKAARLEVRVERVTSLTHIEDHMISANRLEGDWHRSRVCTGDVLRESVFDCYDNSIRDRERLGAVASVAFILQLIAGPGLAVLAQ